MNETGAYVSRTIRIIAFPLVLLAITAIIMGNRVYCAVNYELHLFGNRANSGFEGGAGRIIANRNSYGPIIDFSKFEKDGAANGNRVIGEGTMPIGEGGWRYASDAN